MKLLLTSGGITNQTIAEALLALAGMPLNKVKVGFIPTAANVEEGNKDWFFLQIDNLRLWGVQWIDVVDVSASGVNWQGRLADVDVLFVSGGNTFHLLHQVRQTNFGAWVKANLKNKVYVGVSAGTIIATPTIKLATMPPGDPNLPNLKDLTGLSLVEVEVEPHCDEARFSSVKTYASLRPNPVYALDDASAIVVTNGKHRVVSEGSWKVFNDEE